MAWTKVKNAPAVNANGVSSQTSTFASASTTNNLLILVCGMRDAGDVTLNTPSGWSAVPRQTDGATPIAAITQIFYKISTGDTSVTVSLPSGTGNWTQHLYEFSGNATSGVLDASQGSSRSTQGTSHTFTAVTTTVANDLIIAGLTTEGATGLTTYGNTWTNSFTHLTEEASGGPLNDWAMWCAVAYRAVGAAGSYGTAESWSGQHTAAGVLAAFKEAAPDTTQPTVTINQATGQADPTGASPINFTATFSEAVTGFTAADVTISGTAGGTKTVTIGSPTMVGVTQVYNVAVSGMTTAGTVIATIPSGVVTDAAGNTNTASTSTDNTVQWSGTDTTNPTVTINQAGSQADPTNTSPINFTVVFSESVTGFGNTDVTISGTAGGTKTVVVTGSGTTYNVAVSGMTTKGTVIATIPAGGASDAAGNTNDASTSTDNTVTWDATPPTFSTVEVPSGAATTVVCTADEPLNLSFVPLVSQFTVKVGGTARTINSLTYDNGGPGGVGRVTLTLASAVTAGQVVTLDYAQ